MSAAGSTKLQWTTPSDNTYWSSTSIQLNFWLTPRAATAKEKYPRMNVDHDQESRLLPPAMLGKSFLLVVGCYVFSFITMWGTFIALAMVFFPTIFKQLINSEPEVIRHAFENDPDAIFPRPLYWGWLAANGMISLCIGWTIARLAPFGKFPHAVFLAVLMFVSCLQQVIAAPASSKWMFVLMMGVLPISELIGAGLALSPAGDDEAGQGSVE